VDGIQGYENNNTILDIVHSYGIGFTGQHNRLTVTLTRYKFLLITVINLDMLPKSVDHLERVLLMEFIKKLIDIHKHNQKVVNIKADSSIYYRCHEASY
jgi:hypothetical protein